VEYAGELVEEKGPEIVEEPLHAGLIVSPEVAAQM